jgi:predicted amidohydrolase YtcJ
VQREPALEGALMNRREFFKQSASGVAVGAALRRPGMPSGAAFLDQAGATGAASAPRDDLAIINAKLVTLNPRQSAAEGVLVRNGRIAFVGPSNEIKKQAREARVFDAGGRTIVPGFIDAHTHFEMTCNARAYQTAVHTPPLKSLREITEVVRAKAAQTRPGDWIIARGSFGMAGRVDEKRLLSRADLDLVTDRHPVIVFSGFHVAMFNTAGLKAAELWDPNSRSIPRAATIHRDASGVPTGVATEVWTTLPAYPREQVRASVKQYTPPLFTAKGITTVHTLPYGPDDVRAIQDLHASGDLPMRVRVFYHVPHVTSLESVLSLGLVTGAGDDIFQFGGVKIFVDGIGNDGLGKALDDVKWTQPELNDFVARSDGADIQLMMHTLTDKGEQMAMAALVHAAGRGPRRRSHRLEHADGGEDIAMIRRFKQLDLRPVITVSDPAPASAGARRARRTPRWKTMVQEGVEPIAVSDTTGTVPEFSPLGGIAHMMTSSNDGGSAPAGEILTFEDALRTYTSFPARSAYEGDKGSIEVGKLGDFAVLSADPRALRGSHLWDVKVEVTVLGGRIVHGQ